MWKIYFVVPIIIFLLIMLVLSYSLIIPLMSFAGDDVYNDIKVKDQNDFFEGGSENGGAEKKLSAAKVLPQELQWMEIDKEKLRSFLNSRNSILAEEKYLGSLIEVARKKNVNVILLIAITGQEQSFVPRNKGNPQKVANNPFNVFHSWMEYNTDIGDSASIACNTIINLSKGRPEAIHPIQWINRKYAEDKKWWIGVSTFFVQIKSYVT